MNNFTQKINKIFSKHLSEEPGNMVSKMNFEDDLVVGESGEEYIKNFLINKGYSFISDNKDYRYDLLMSFNAINITYEVKTDVFVSSKKDTGNLVVEFESRGKPSGISVTEGDYYVYYMPKLNEIWNIKMSELKALIEDNEFRKVSGGDEGSNTKMYLIKRELYKNYFKIYKT